MKIKHFIIGFSFLVLSAVFAPIFAYADLFYLSGNDLRPVVGTWGLKIPGTASSTTGCLSISSTGYISPSGSACGGSGSTPDSKWATSTVTTSIYAAGATKVGVSTTSPWAKLSVSALASETTDPLFTLSTSTASATSTAFIVTAAGRVGVATTSPSDPFAVQGNFFQNGTFAHFGNSSCGYDNKLVGGTGVEFCFNDNSIGGGNIILSNRNAGASAFSDIFFQNDLSTNGALNQYAVINYNSSVYNDNTFGTGVNVANQFLINNTTGPVAIFASTSTSPGYIEFSTGGSAIANERMRITNTGLIGMGTTTPWGLLSVHSNALGSGVPQFVVGSSTKTDFIVEDSGVVGVGLSNPSALLDVENTGTVNSFRVGDSAGDTSPFLVDNAGRIAMGPSGTLANAELNWSATNAGPQMSFLRSDTVITAGEGLGFIDLGGSDGNNFDAIRIQGVAETAFTGSEQASTLQFQTSNTGIITPTTKMVIMGNGAVGIGTSSPLHVLSVVASSTSQTPLFSILGPTPSAVSTSTLVLVDANGRMGLGTTTIGGMFALAHNSNATGVPVFLISTSTATATTTAVIIDGNGRMGVGTTTLWTTVGMNGSGAWSNLTPVGSTKNSVCIDGTTKEIQENAASSCLVSSRRFKHDIETLSTKEAENIINKLRPVSFEYNEGDVKALGLIAEEVFAIDSRLATKNAKGQINSINYEQITSSLVKVVQNIFAKVTGLEKRMNIVEKENKELKARLEAIERKLK